MSEPRTLTSRDIRERVARSARASLTGHPSGDSWARTVDARYLLDGDERQALRRAVALLDVFQADSLAAISDDRSVAAFVATDCERVTGPHGDGWRLRGGARRAALAGAASASDLLAALDIVRPAPGDLASAMAAAILTGEVHLETRSPQELAATLRALEWLRETRYPRPTIDEVTAALELASVLVPLRAVVNDRFVGRESELAAIDDFVSGVAGESMPLLLHGPGGVGKSTLVARFILKRLDDFSSNALAGPLTFAYLTFDRMDLTPMRPLTLLGEACRQLRSQDRGLGPDLAGLEDAIAAAIRLGTAETAEVSPSRSNSSYAVRRDEREERALIAGFAAILRESLARRGGEVLWVLDTFEQAQRHGPIGIARLETFLEVLRAHCPQVRVLVAGRADDEHLSCRPLPLLGFDAVGAVGFLRAQLAPVAVDTELLSQVVELTRGNPLSLRLAADLIRRSPVDELQTELGQTVLLRDLKPELLQGMLYRRILDHIATPEIKALANPGLVVRRITPDIIASVLAVPCGLGPVDEPAARELFEKFRLEVSLVSSEGADVLVHRSDVRSEMLPLLALHDQARFEQINRAAVAYYQGRDTPRERAEEIYHRLMLGQDSADLDLHWEPSASYWLHDALDEVPASARAYLAHRLGVQVGPNAMQEADDVSWTRKAAQEVRSLLDAGRPLEALSLLKSRGSTALDPALLPLRIEAYAAAGQLEDALNWLSRGLEHPATTDETSAALYLLGARVYEDANDFDQAQRLAESALSTATEDSLRVTQASALAALVRINRRRGTASSRGAVALRADLLELASSLTAYERIRNPSLLRELAAEVGSAMPDLLKEAAAVSGIDVFDQDELNHGGSASPNVEGSPPPPLLPAKTRAKLRDILALINKVQAGSLTSSGNATDPESAESPMAPGIGYWSGHDAGTSIGDYLSAATDDKEAVDAVSEYFRSEVDASTYDYQVDSDGSYGSDASDG